MAPGQDTQAAAGGPGSVLNLVASRSSPGTQHLAPLSLSILSYKEGSAGILSTLISFKWTIFDPTIHPWTISLDDSCYLQNNVCTRTRVAALAVVTNSLNACQ